MSAGRVCEVEGCDRPFLARGWCRTHYVRWHRRGTVEYQPPTIADRLWPKVTKTDDCWLWNGALDHGYGVIWIGSRNFRTHRVAYELLVGPIPEGLTLDHLCHTADPSCTEGEGCLHRRCVNPAHLEPVSGVENTLRGRGPTGTNARRTECLRGHEFTAENTYVSPQGKRGCRSCQRLRSQARAA